MSTAIVTRYIAPTNTRGARIEAKTMNGKHSRKFAYAYTGTEQEHHTAAHSLAHELKWDGDWVSGGTTDGNVYVRLMPGAQNVECAFHVRTD